MSYDTAALTCIMHLHFLHILHFLLAHRDHRIGLRQQNDSSVIEHSSYDGRTLYQPIEREFRLGIFSALCELTRLQEIET